VKRVPVSDLRPHSRKVGFQWFTVLKPAAGFEQDWRTIHFLLTPMSVLLLSASLVSLPKAVCGRGSQVIPEVNQK
jgi:hypothetical protein